MVENNTTITKTRSSNLELYRIICMLMIVAHHYVANSGLAVVNGPIALHPFSTNSVYLAFFGAWGKTGINCFLMITGYFMCTSQITFRKFLKLMLQIYLYKLLLYPIFLLAGYEKFTASRLFTLLMPVEGFSSNDFVSCFIAFWLTIPFWTILVKNITKRQHQLLLLLLLTCFTLLPSFPSFVAKVNYITWFGVIFLIASYIRMYPTPITQKTALWGGLTLVSIVLALLSILVMTRFSIFRYKYLEDSNSLFAVAVSVSSFMWFKNLNIKYSKIINAFGAGTFGVLLIHANSNAMRSWLWKDFFDCLGSYTLPFGSLVLYSCGAVLLVFLVCNLIDQIRIATIEKTFLNYFDKSMASKMDSFIEKILNDKQRAA